MKDPNSPLPDLTATAYNSTFEDLSGVATLGEEQPLYKEDAQFARDAQPTDQTNPSSFQGV